jgi:hypothetical protein
MHLRMLLVGPEMTTRRGWTLKQTRDLRVSFACPPTTSAFRVSILPEWPSEYPIREDYRADIRGSRTSVGIEIGRAPLYRFRLPDGFDRDLSSTTELFPYTVEILSRRCLRPEAKAHSASAGGRVWSVSWSWQTSENHFRAGGCF